MKDAPFAAELRKADGRHGADSHDASSRARERRSTTRPRERLRALGYTD